MAEQSKVQATDKLWTIPNMLSILRIILVIPIVQQLRENTPVSNFNAFLLIALAYATDFLDGFLARKMKCISKVGQILDPIGDKLLAITIAALLYFGKQAPLYLFCLILIRDIAISVGALYAINVQKTILLPLLAGKITTFVLGLVFCLYVLSYSFIMQYGAVSVWISFGVKYGTYLAAAMLLISGLIYLVDYIRNFLSKRKDAKKESL